MVIYLKFNAEDQAEQFTTVLEAKEKIAARPGGSGIYFAVKKDPVNNQDQLTFHTFGSNDVESAREKLDERVAEVSEEAE